jgi:hypothetical protein
MKHLFLAAILLGCGGVTPDEVDACEAATRRIPETRGCAFRWSSCFPKDGHAWCAFGMDCDGRAVEGTNTCTTVTP